jgi:hypothetical protein
MRHRYEVVNVSMGGCARKADDRASRHHISVNPGPSLSFVTMMDASTLLLEMDFPTSGISRTI